MDYNEIRSLLEKYLNGETSIIEEKQLRTFFLESDTFPQDLQYARDMFLQYEADRQQKFEGKLTLPVRKINWLKWGGIAASILAVVGSTYFFLPSTADNVYAIVDGKPVKDRQHAILETKKALFMITHKLNHGKKGLKHLTKFNQMEQLISKDQNQ